MTIKELAEHCRKTVAYHVDFARHRGIEPGGKTYEEHRLTLSLCEKQMKLEKILKDYGFKKEEKSEMKYLSDLERELINEIYDWNKPKSCLIFGKAEKCFGGATENECSNCDYKA